MAAVVLQDDATLTPAELEEFLAAQSDLSPKAWPRYVRVAPDLPSTATNKVLKRELAAQGASAGDGVLWTREERGRSYSPTPEEPARIVTDARSGSVRESGPTRIR
jgi:fatty-acyl-CoA synthase